MKKEDDGLTLVELLVAIAIVGVIAAIAMPVLIDAVENGRSKANTASTVNVEQFLTDWTTAGATFETNNGVISAVVNGKVMAEINVP